MIKYLPRMTSVVLEEIPDMVSLAVDITNCQERCPGCHSPFLREDIGEVLDEKAIDKLIGDNFGVTCFLFLGEGADVGRIVELGSYVREHHHIASALYSGRDEVEPEVYRAFDFVKVGPYNAFRGPLNKRTTNQRLYKVSHQSATDYSLEDIPSRFWRTGIDPLKK